MFRQILYFVTDGPVSAEVHTREAFGEVEVDIRLVPPGSGCGVATLSSPDLAADIVERRIRRHLAAHKASLEQIVIQHDLEPLTFAHLASLLNPEEAAPF